MPLVLSHKLHADGRLWRPSNMCESEVTVVLAFRSWVFADQEIRSWSDLCQSEPIDGQNRHHHGRELRHREGDGEGSREER